VAVPKGHRRVVCARGIVMQAYCPVVRGSRFEESSVKNLADKYNKTPAQILIRWSLDRGFIPLPKSVTQSRIIENANWRRLSTVLLHGILPHLSWRIRFEVKRIS
jgi:diketogulonate reductase-like aldo/keto reductase